MDNIVIKRNDVIILFNQDVLIAINKSYARLNGELKRIKDYLCNIKKIIRRGIDYVERTSYKDSFRQNINHTKAVRKEYLYRGQLLSKMYSSESNEKS